jgi:hypothetical protein
MDGGIEPITTNPLDYTLNLDGPDVIDTVFLESLCDEPTGVTLSVIIESDLCEPILFEPDISGMCHDEVFGEDDTLRVCEGITPGTQIILAANAECAPCWRVPPENPTANCTTSIMVTMDADLTVSVEED